jgi:hypothetical protein
MKGGLFNALTGSGGIKIEIKLVPQQQQQQHSDGPMISTDIVPMDHYPSWKLHKNPFWRVKHPSSSLNKMAAVAPNAITGELEVKSQLFAYEAKQDVGGVVTLHIAPGKKIEHLGIKIQFIGRIDMVSVFCEVVLTLCCVTEMDTSSYQVGS